ncbi:hypothetical protein H0H81_004377, partial [Sphagnurus paluster]
MNTLMLSPAQTTFKQDIFSVLCGASHEMLLQSRNSPYNRLIQQNTMLEAELKATNSDATVNASSVISGPLKEFEVYAHKDFPQVTIWTARDWLASPKNWKNNESGIHQQSSKRGKQSTGERTSMGYIQDRRGFPVSAPTAASISNFAHSIWRDLASHNLAPKTWTKILPHAYQYYRQEMFKFYDDLRLADGDWKIERLAIDLYPGWYRTYLKETKEESEDDSATTLKRKRSSTSLPMVSMAKREKNEESVLRPSRSVENVESVQALSDKAVPDCEMSDTDSGDVAHAPVPQLSKPVAKDTPVDSQRAVDVSGACVNTNAGAAANPETSVDTDLTINSTPNVLDVNVTATDAGIVFDAVDDAVDAANNLSVAISDSSPSVDTSSVANISATQFDTVPQNEDIGPATVHVNNSAGTSELGAVGDMTTNLGGTEKKIGTTFK